MSDYQELRDALAAATPGPWHTGGEDSHWSRQIRRPDHQSVAWCGHIAPQALRDAEYIAAANPQTISDLLSDLDAARAEIARFSSPKPKPKQPHRHAALGFTWHGKLCPCGDVQNSQCRKRGCRWENNPQLVPEELRLPIPEAKP